MECKCGAWMAETRRKESSYEGVFDVLWECPKCGNRVPGQAGSREAFAAFDRALAESEGDGYFPEESDEGYYDE